jgi:hypothetical protein
MREFTWKIEGEYHGKYLILNANLERIANAILKAGGSGGFQPAAFALPGERP